MNILYRIIKCFPILDQRIFFVSKLPVTGTLLDIGCGKGLVLKRFIEVRPDISIYGVDINNYREFLPSKVNFTELDIKDNRLPFPDNYFDGISIIHVIEHINDITGLMREVVRVLKNNGIFYIETPDNKTLKFPGLGFIFKDKEGGPLNFSDDPTHCKLWAKSDLLNILPCNILKLGIYRNYLYALLSPVLIILGLILKKRRWFVVGVHHLLGWSLYCSGVNNKNDTSRKSGS